MLSGMLWERPSSAVQIALGTLGVTISLPYLKQRTKPLLTPIGIDFDTLKGGVHWTIKEPAILGAVGEGSARSRAHEGAIAGRDRTDRHGGQV